MSGITIIAVMSIINAALLSAILYIFVTESKKHQKLIAEDRQNLYSSISGLTDKVKKIFKAPEPHYSNEMTAQTISPNIGLSRAEMVVQRLKGGASPEQVSRELGFSRSEIGIIMATAKTSNKNHETVAARL